MAFLSVLFCKVMGSLSACSFIQWTSSVSGGGCTQGARLGSCPCVAGSPVGVADVKQEEQLCPVLGGHRPGSLEGVCWGVGADPVCADSGAS